MAMEGSLQEILERLLAGQVKAIAEMKANINANITVSQEKADAELNAAMHSMRSDIERSLHRQLGALLEGSKSFGTRATICRVPPMACPEETETASCPEEMDATRLVNPGAAEAAVERQELREKEINAENIGSSEDRSGYRRLVVRRRRGAKKWIPVEGVCRPPVIRRAVPALRKRNIRKGPGRNSVGRVDPKSRTFRKKQRLRSEYYKRINCRDSRQTATSADEEDIQQVLQEAHETGDGESSIRFYNWTFWKVRPVAKRKKDVLTA
jgi:hypothetical protein